MSNLFDRIKQTVESFRGRMPVHTRPPVSQPEPPPEQPHEATYKFIIIKKTKAHAIIAEIYCPYKNPMKRIVMRIKVIIDDLRSSAFLA